MAKRSFVAEVNFKLAYSYEQFRRVEVGSR